VGGGPDLAVGTSVAGTSPVDAAFQLAIHISLLFYFSETFRYTNLEDRDPQCHCHRFYAIPINKKRLLENSY